MKYENPSDSDGPYEPEDQLIHGSGNEPDGIVLDRFREYLPPTAVGGSGVDMPQEFFNIFGPLFELDYMHERTLSMMQSQDGPTSHHFLRTTEHTLERINEVLDEYEDRSFTDAFEEEYREIRTRLGAASISEVREPDL